MITYQDYLKILEEKNILLYDFQKRISYFRFNELEKNKKSNLYLVGGSGEKKIDISDLNTYQVEKLVILLLNKNYDMIRTNFK